MVTTRHVLGLDLGPAGAFTALAIIGRTEDDGPDAPPDPTYTVRHLARFPPGTRYEAVVEAVAGLLATEDLEGTQVVADVTAVGAGVLRLLRDHESHPTVVPVVITAGLHAEYDQRGAWLVPKKDLVTGLQILLQARRLAIPAALPNADLLARELAQFRAKATLAADPAQAEWREGRDDDLVLAVALGCWQAARLELPNMWSGIEAFGGRTSSLYSTPYPPQFCPQFWRRPWRG